jgi:hypothetical protein
MNFEYPIYCINLEERKDRKENIKKEFSKLNIDLSIVKFLKFNRDIRGGRYGCYDSHVKVWNEFYHNSKSNYCLIFEDDFVSNNNCKGIIEKGKIFMDNNNLNVDFLFLHNIFVNSNINKNEVSKDINNENFCKGLGSLAHAYFISKNYIKNLINKYEYNWMNPDGLDIDITINCNRKHMIYSDKCYYTKNIMFTQLFQESNNCYNLLDIVIRLPLIQYISKDIVQNIVKLVLVNNIYNEKELQDKVYQLYLLNVKK